MSGLLVDIVNAEIRDQALTLVGEIQGRPSLSKTDGTVLTYCVDVRISTDDPSGVAYTEETDPVIDRTKNAILRSVPLAANNRDLIYAESGAAVTLSRSPGGKWEITGLSKRKPGTRTLVAVDVSTMIPETPQSVGVTTHVLTFGEMADQKYGGFGVVPLGAYAILQGTTVLAVKT